MRSMQIKKSKQKKERIRMLDFLRGTAVWMMIGFHSFYTFGMICGIDFFARGYLRMQNIAPPIISVLFIFACAYSCALARSNVKRGAFIFAVAVGLSLVTICLLPLFGMTREGIYFGILHFLGVAVMLSGGMLWLAKKIPWYLAVPAASCLAIGTREMMIRGFFGIPVADFLTRGMNLLFPFGIYNASFYSADYYPIFPWIFVFFIGCYLPQLFPPKKLPSFCFKKICPPVEFAGRHALVIYLVHQPIIFAVGSLLAAVRAF